MSYELLRKSEVLRIKGDSKSSTYVQIKDGTFTEPVKLGPRASAWPDYEVYAINAAKIAGWSKGEIRRLVQNLHEFRKTVPGMTDSEIKQGVSQLIAGIQAAA
ncbi:MAG: AlpA family phage regulatory protein [Pseudomonadota bacterium]